MTRLLLLCALVVGIGGCSVPHEHPEYVRVPEVAPIEQHKDPIYSHYNGCNTTYCDGDGGCWSTLKWCGDPHEVLDLPLPFDGNVAPCEDDDDNLCMTIEEAK